MNNKLFGIVALVGLIYFWLSERDLQAEQPRTLTASWYSKSKRKDNLMANGHRFNPDALTAASWSYPLGTRLKVIGPYGPVVVEVTDRGPAKRLLRTRQIDLSRRAFALVCPLDAGLIGVTVEVIP